MKNGIKYCWIIFLCCVVIACNNSKKQQENKGLFSKEDTTEVIRLATEYLEHLKNKDFDNAIKMLHLVKGDSIYSLSTEEQENLMQQYMSFPVLSYNIENLYLTGVRSTEIVYRIEFFEKQEKDKRPNTLKFRLNPQRINNVWYLSVLNR